MMKDYLSKDLLHLVIVFPGSLKLPVKAVLQSVVRYRLIHAVKASRPEANASSGMNVYLRTPPNARHLYAPKESAILPAPSALNTVSATNRRYALSFLSHLIAVMDVPTASHVLLLRDFMMPNTLIRHTNEFFQTREPAFL